MEELFRKITLWSKRIRMELGEPRFVYGEIYADIVFGALLSIIEDNATKTALLDMAFKEYRNESAMCVSLERECVLKNAMVTAEKLGIEETICSRLAISNENLEIIRKIVDQYILNVKTV